MMATPTQTRSEQQAGFTLVELLVALTMLSVTIAISSSMIISLRTNTRATDVSAMNLAAQKWFEESANAWIDQAAYGDVGRLTTPPSVDGATWRARICRVIAADGTTDCGPEVNSGKPAYDSNGTSTVVSGVNGVNLIQLRLTYTREGTDTLYSTELVRP